MIHSSRNTSKQNRPHQDHHNHRFHCWYWTHQSFHFLLLVLQVYFFHKQQFEPENFKLKTHHPQYQTEFNFSSQITERTTIRLLIFYELQCKILEFFWKVKMKRIDLTIISFIVNTELIIPSFVFILLQLDFSFVRTNLKAE